ncbi:MAG: hypothetical protein CM1200mP12_23150 [Gammaproteobacteria bacterium]|nr:MAG: hypothetical protein CM1200mP12_23150 [Gammaproteobacteria bacterium]
MKGEKFFSAGADLKVFHEGGKTAAADMGDAFSMHFRPSAVLEGFPLLLLMVMQWVEDLNALWLATLE